MHLTDPIKKGKLSLIIASILFSAPSWSNEQCDLNVTAHCLPFNQWFIGGQVGSSETDLDNSDINNALSDTQLTADNVSFDDNDTAYELFVGYRFNRFFALQAGYQDLGDRELTYRGPADNEDDFYQHVEDIFPDSGDGIKISVIASWPIDEKWSVSGKLGLFDWEQDYDGMDSNRLAKDSVDGTDLTYGIELGYHFRRDMQVYAAFDSVKLENNKVNTLGLGLRYFFGEASAPQTPIAKKLPAQPTPPENKAKPLVTAVPMDTDKDGVFDNRDQCAETPITHKVDANGCSIYQDEVKSIGLEVSFANNSAMIEKNELDDIKAVADFMNEHPQSNITLEGHTSALGAATYNKALSQRRADAVAKALNEEHGIALNRIKTVGYGETQLLDNRNTAQAHAKNRRITAHINLNKKVVVEK